jgi:hypothetical protein
VGLGWMLVEQTAAGSKQTDMQAGIEAQNIRLTVVAQLIHPNFIYLHSYEFYENKSTPPKTITQYAFSTNSRCHLL